MKTIFLVVLVALVVKGDNVVTQEDATAYYNAIQAALQQAALTPINWAANLSAPANISQMMHVYCAKANGTTFEEVFLNDVNVTLKLNFVNTQTILMFHGWISNTSESWATDFKNNWVASNRSNTNMCLVDWADLAYSDYFTTAAINSRLVANYFSGVYLPWLVTKGLNYSDIILMGHSMGGQILGQIGAALPKKIKFMIGMDPAGPLFQDIPAIYRLSEDDADYVQIIHTDMGEYGYAGKCGDADYYLNLGLSPQSKCGFLNTTSDAVALHCSHARALAIIIDSFLYPLQYSCKGVKCISVLSYLSKLCIPIVTDIFGLDSAKIVGEFYTSTAGSTTCTGALWLNS